MTNLHNRQKYIRNIFVTEDENWRFHDITLFYVRINKKTDNLLKLASINVNDSTVYMCTVHLSYLCPCRLRRDYCSLCQAYNCTKKKERNQWKQTVCVKVYEVKTYSILYIYSHKPFIFNSTCSSCKIV